MPSHTPFLSFFQQNQMVMRCVYSRCEPVEEEDDDDQAKIQTTMDVNVCVSLSLARSLAGCRHFWQLPIVFRFSQAARPSQSRTFLPPLLMTRFSPLSSSSSSCCCCCCYHVDKQLTNHRLTVYSLECSLTSSPSSSSSYLSIVVQNHILTICSWRRWGTTNREYVSHHVETATRQWLGHFYSPVMSFPT